MCRAATWLEFSLESAAPMLHTDQIVFLKGKRALKVIHVQLSFMPKMFCLAFFTRALSFSCTFRHTHFILQHSICFLKGADDTGAVWIRMFLF